MSENLEDPEFWHALNPDFPITDDPWPKAAAPYPYSPTGKEADLIRKRGYLQFDEIAPKQDLTRLATLVMRMCFKGYHPAYSLLYDEAYGLLSRFGAVLAPVLGDRILFLPDEFDCHFVPPNDNTQGAGPHRDNLVADGPMFDESGLPNVVNLWLALTDATVTNGCMHVIPAFRDKGFLTGDWRPDGTSFGFQDVQALPVSAGSVLYWSPRLMHWGGRSNFTAKGPRISMACYFQRADVDRLHEKAMEIGAPLPFDHRLKLVQKTVGPE